MRRQEVSKGGQRGIFRGGGQRTDLLSQFKKLQYQGLSGDPRTPAGNKLSLFLPQPHMLGDGLDTVYIYSNYRHNGTGYHVHSSSELLLVTVHVCHHILP